MARIRMPTSAFVATNSICQGQQVPILWPLIFADGITISLSHTRRSNGQTSPATMPVSRSLSSGCRDQAGKSELFSIER